MLLLVSALYCATGIDKVLNGGSWWWGLFWFSYATANIALIKAT
jgi:hypothetical protein